MTDLVGIQTEIIINLLRAANVANGRCYDEAPNNIDTGGGAYVESDSGLETEADDVTGEGIEHYITLVVHSQHRGFKECKDVVKEIRDALHHEAFAVGTANCIVWVDNVTYLTEPDGVTRRAVVRVRIISRT